MGSFSDVQILQGFFLFFSADIDECTEPAHGCSQLCNNTLGSYNCFCLKGYLLEKDNKTCVGRLSSKTSRLFFLPWASLRDLCDSLIRFRSKLMAKVFEEGSSQYTN